eukprot:TRINITY_DN11457_c0_g1_i1.p1 TRINITY_DN11457_c0_g1~~TRINITY_DN11457_c0_g1_i1.p1  ORF type:complete len:1002 (+),score=149.89 TRINITY_DN11457_c0_g1_i1:1409-4414(+)
MWKIGVLQSVWHVDRPAPSGHARVQGHVHLECGAADGSWPERLPDACAARGRPAARRQRTPAGDDHLAGRSTAGGAAERVARRADPAGDGGSDARGSDSRFSNQGFGRRAGHAADTCRTMSENSKASGRDGNIGYPNDESLKDISDGICWSGDYTKERCCRGDPTTTPDCWDGMYSFGECCPNADCWDTGGSFTYETCCGKKYGDGGNPACWSDSFTYQHCCLANSTAHTWADVMVAGVDTEQFYAMDDFYTDAQYGDDFGYYSKGHVLMKAGPGTSLNDTHQFAHFTTYPMILSPHVGRVFCRLLLVMWIQLKERAPFRVVEMGAGSGQLSHDIQQCVRHNELGVAPPVWRRWAAAFEYLIMERSPALAQRQRDRGLRVVPGDAQSVSSCKPVLAALAASHACTGVAAQGAAECKVHERGTEEAGASVVISNELLDAFAPVKLRLSLYGSPNITSCKAWEEVKLVHTAPLNQLQGIWEMLGYDMDRILGMSEYLQSYTEQVFCAMSNTTIGLEASKRLEPNISCMALTFGLTELVNHLDLGVPAASHNMRLRLRKDVKLWQRLREVVRRLQDELQGSVAMPRDIYRQLRHQLRDQPELESHFLTVANTHHIPVTIPAQRCESLSWWFVAHQDRVARLAGFYRSLGYPALHVVVRPGERDFINLVDCLLGPTGGYKLSVDYGATFEGLAHSLSIDPGNDGIFVPPIPHELMQDLPECHNFWPKCAGRIDWTTFVDFTNLAAAGEMHGWRTIFYGPQSLLEHVSRVNMTTERGAYSVPGYSVLEKSTWSSRHVHGWYGKEVSDGNWVQRWTSFKALVLEKPSADQPPNPVFFPSWHLDHSEISKCWSFDPSTVPLSDWLPRAGAGNNREGLKLLTDETNDRLGKDYALGYEDAQLAVRLVDWLVATGGCESLQSHRASALLNSEGLWGGLRRRLVKKWRHIWGEERLAELMRDILGRLGEDPQTRRQNEEPASPAVCAGVQTYSTLCEDPGGASFMSWREGT